MKISERVAEFISTYPDREIPKGVLPRAKDGIIDYVGVTLAGGEEESVKRVREVAENMGGASQATIWSTGRKTSVTLAALVNGTAAHALDFDDTNLVMVAHPSIQLLPGLCALGEYQHSSGYDILTAYIIGFELGAVLGRALNPNHIIQGWFPVGTLGLIMQTAAAARLLRLTPRQTQMALGLGMNLASGLRCNSGTMAKPLLAGQAASNSILVALLARNGITANPDALEDRFGYFENFSRGSHIDLKQAVDSLGTRWNIVESGIAFKLYPCCAGAHIPIDCALEIAQRHSPQPEEIESIEISIPSAVKIMLLHPSPKTAAEARFSLEYCVSRAILDRKLGLEQFLPQKLDDPSVRILIGKIKISYYDLSLIKDKARQNRFPVEIKVRVKGGAVFSAGAEYAKGTPENPVSSTFLEEKLYQCCSEKLPVSEIRDILSRLRDFERIKDISELISMFNMKAGLAP